MITRQTTITFEQQQAKVTAETINGNTTLTITKLDVVSGELTTIELMLNSYEFCDLRINLMSAA